MHEIVPIFQFVRRANTNAKVPFCKTAFVTVN